MKIKFFIISILISSCANAQWQLYSVGDTSAQTFCFLEYSGVMFAGAHNAIYSSTDNGNSWFNSDSGIASGCHVLSLGKNSTGIFAGTKGIYYSGNNGSSWTLASNNNFYTQTLLFSSDTGYAATVGNGVMRSIDNGISWTTANTGIASTSLRSIIKKGSLLFVGTDFNGLYKSVNGGNNWTHMSFTPQGVPCLETDGINIYAGTAGDGIYISSNNGTSWTHATGIPPIIWVNDIKHVGNALLSVAGGHIYRSLDSGLTWTKFSNGIDTTCFTGGSKLYVTSNYVFLGTSDSCQRTIYRIDRNEVLSVNRITANKINFSISPNPFQYSTLLYSNQPISNAILNIYSINGRLVKQLNNIKGQSVTINRGNLAGGLYLMQLIQDDKTIFSEKLVIIDY